ncbi:MAG: ATP-binding protein [Planctomycetaceae bacterium]|nr:ATP-binding protein [Planctomycetaceae bacterium]
MRLQTRIVLWSLGTILVATTVTLALTLAMLAWKSRGSLERDLFEVADIVAGLPEVRSGLALSPFDGQVQDRVHKIADSGTRVDSIIVCDMDGRIYSNPNNFLLGLRHDDPAAATVLQKGLRHTDTTRTLYGEMIRVYVPVFESGRQVGYVEVGAMLAKLDDERRQLYLSAAIFLLAGLGLGGIGAVYQARRIKSVLLGLEPEEIVQLYHAHAGMVEHIHAGVLAINRNGAVLMANDRARRLLGIGDADLQGLDIDKIMPDTAVQEVVESGEPRFDYEQRVNDRVIISNIVPIVDKGRVTGVVETLQDRTQLVRMAAELVGIRQLVEALRANSHEFSNKLQAVLGMLEMADYDAARDFILGTQARHGHLDRQLMHSLKSPMLAGLLLGKINVASEQGVDLTVDPASSLGEIADPAVAHELVTIIGNLVDNAIESVRGRSAAGEVILAITDADGRIAVTIRDNGPGIQQKTMESIFIRGFSTKGEGRGTGLYLVKRAVRLLGGEISVQSNPGRTVFTVTIPRDSGEQP